MHLVHIQPFRERLSELKYVHATVPKGNMGYDLYTYPNDCSCRIYFCCFHLAAHRHTSMASHAILSYFFEEHWTKNHLQYLSGLSCALFLTTFLEKAVYGHSFYELSRMLMRKKCKQWRQQRFAYIISSRQSNKL